MIRQVLPDLATSCAKGTDYCGGSGPIVWVLLWLLAIAGAAAIIWIGVVVWRHDQRRRLGEEVLDADDAPTPGR